jgi:multidrug efflux pump subunit AcrB
VNGKPAIGIGISTVQGGNVVTMGEGVERRLAQLMSEIPLGMDIEVITWQSAAVTKAINGFLVNLIEAVVIVFVVLLFAMGIRSGLIIGGILVLTISATFLVMGMQQIILERISLGALIIALGMLVDNAIVVVEGMKVRIEGGEDGLSAAKAVVGQNGVPLMGATFVAVAAFASIGTSQDSTGEFCRSLFFVILISLTLSWVTAVTTTPLICTKLFKSQQIKDGGAKRDPYGGALFRVYRKFLTMAIRMRWVTIAVVVSIFLLAMFGFGYVSQMFFPASTQPQFLVEVFFREGTHIRETELRLARAEEYLLGIEGVNGVATSIGSGHARFQLTYDAPMEASTNYGIIIVSVDDYKLIDQIYDPTLSDLESLLPEAIVNVKKFKIGPGVGGQIQLRINGSDPAVLRELANQVMEVMENDPGTKSVRQEWGEKVKVIQPVLAESQARRMGISRPMLAEAIQTGASGTQTSVFRERDELIPIVARSPERERQRVEDIQDLTIYSPTLDRRVPIDQVLLDLRTGSEDAKLARWHRRTMIKIHCDARSELPSVLLARLKPKIEEVLNVDLATYLGKSFPPEEDPFAEHTAEVIPIKYDDIVPLKDRPGYFIAWGGENEDSAKAQGALAGSIPIFFGLMILIVIMLFNALRQPLVIWLTVPLALIGVTVGLLIFDQPFGFMALLGLMSLSGMLIKNAIVLIDQIDTEIRGGKERFQAVVDSGVSRLRPVALAAVTTIMGMIPLLTDAFFVSMAVTIMFGLGFATLLTLIVVPVLYATIFRIPNPADSQD